MHLFCQELPKLMRAQISEHPIKKKTTCSNRDTIPQFSNYINYIKRMERYGVVKKMKHKDKARITTRLLRFYSCCESGHLVYYTRQNREIIRTRHTIFLPHVVFMNCVSSQVSYVFFFSSFPSLA